MKVLGSGRTWRIFCMALTVVLLTSLTGVSAMASQRVNIVEGTYYLKAVNGNAKGQVLYWNDKASDQNISMMFESCGGSHADNEIWFITKNRNFDDYCGIYLAKSYNGDKDRSKRIEIDNLTGRDRPYLASTKGPHVFCGSFGNQDDAFQFFCEKGDNYSTNLTIRSRDDNYTFNRHKEVRVFQHDLIYVNANKDKDTNNKLWELVPVNYIKNMKSAALTLTAQKNGKVTVNWDRLRSKIKSSEAWKNAKYIEIQYSTDKRFVDCVKSIMIKKGTVDKAKARTTLSKLDVKKTYFVRARLVDGEGVCSNWSKTVKVKTKGGSVKIVSNEAEEQNILDGGIDIQIDGINDGIEEIPESEIQIGTDMEVALDAD